MPIKCTIGGTDLSIHLKALAVNGSGPGVVGDATLYLDKDAGGLTITNMMDVRVWKTFDSAGNGVAQRGRLFGGLVTVRETGNISTTKYWELPCSSYQIIAHKTVRDLASAWTVNLTAANFNTMIAQLVTIIQLNFAGTVNTSIDATSQVALSNAMPALTLDPGHSLAWYLDRVCEKAEQVYLGTIKPRWFLDTQRTFGVGDVFGPPTLHIYDSLLVPASSFTFSDNPGVGEYPILKADEGDEASWKRRLDASEIVQRLQSRRPGTGGLVQTYAEGTSQATYPNPYINHSGPANTGYWMNEPISDQESQTTAEQLERLRATVAPIAYPRERISFWVNQPVQVGESVKVTYALEGISAVDYRVVGAHYDVSDPGFTWTLLDLNSRRLGLLEDGTDISAPPVEGDIVPPNPPTGLALLPVGGANDVPAPNRQRRTGFTWTLSTSADVDHQNIAIRLNNLIEPFQISKTQTTFYYPFQPGRQYTVQVFAVDTHGNVSDPAEITFTTLAPQPSDKLYNGDFAIPNPDNTDRAEGWTYTIVGGPTVTLDTTGKIGGYNTAKITLANTPDSVTLLSSPVMCLDTATAAISSAFALATRAMYYASHARNQLSVTVRFYNSSDTNFSSTALLTNGTPIATTKTILSPASLSVPAGAIYARLEIKYAWGGTTGGADLYVGGCVLQEANTGRTTKGSTIGSQNLTDLTSLANPIFVETSPAVLTAATDPILPDGWTKTAQVGTSVYGEQYVGQTLYGAYSLRITDGNTASDSVTFLSQKVSTPTMRTGLKMYARIMYDAEFERGQLWVGVRQYDKNDAEVGSIQYLLDGVTPVAGSGLGGEGVVKEITLNPTHADTCKMAMDVRYASTGTGTNTVWLSGAELELAILARSLGTRWEPMTAVTAGVASIVFDSQGDVIMVEVPNT